MCVKMQPRWQSMEPCDGQSRHRDLKAKSSLTSTGKAAGMTLIRCRPRLSRRCLSSLYSNNGEESLFYPARSEYGRVCSEWPRRPPLSPRHSARGIAISSALPLGTLRRSRRPHQRARTADHIIEETGPCHLPRAGTLHAGARDLAALIPVRLFPRSVWSRELAVPMPSAVDVHPLEDAAVAEGVPDERANQWHSEGAHQSQSRGRRRNLT